MPPPSRAFKARISPALWAADLDRSTEAGRDAARQARGRYERQGIRASELRACDTEARDGTDLPNCRKVYLPPPAGRFGIVFEVRILDGELQLIYLAFGVRHQPEGSHAPSVYQLAHQRILQPPSAES